MKVGEKQMEHAKIGKYFVNVPQKEYKLYTYAALRKWLLKSPPYKKWAQGKPETIRYDDVCYMLEGTMDTDPALLHKNFETVWRILEGGRPQKGKFLNIATEKTTVELFACLKWIWERF